jgi:hypothetical protein
MFVLNMLGNTPTGLAAAAKWREEEIVAEGGGQGEGVNAKHTHTLLLLVLLGNFLLVLPAATFTVTFTVNAQLNSGAAHKGAARA